MDIEDLEEKVKKGTSLFDTIWDFFIKRWWKMLILGVAAFVIWFVYLVVTDVNADSIYEEEQYEEYIK